MSSIFFANEIKRLKILTSTWNRGERARDPKKFDDLLIAKVSWTWSLRLYVCELFILLKQRPRRNSVWEKSFVFFFFEEAPWRCLKASSSGQTFNRLSNFSRRHQDDSEWPNAYSKHPLQCPLGLEDTCTCLGTWDRVRWIEEQTEWRFENSYSHPEMRWQEENNKCSDVSIFITFNKHSWLSHGRKSSDRIKRKMDLEWLKKSSLELHDRRDFSLFSKSSRIRSLFSIFIHA